MTAITLGTKSVKVNKSINLSSDLWNRLEAQAKRRNMSRSEVIEKLLTQALPLVESPSN